MASLNSLGVVTNLDGRPLVNLSAQTEKLGAGVKMLIEPTWLRQGEVSPVLLSGCWRLVQTLHLLGSIF